MKTIHDLRSEITDGKQKITYTNTKNGVEYCVTLVFSAEGNGQRDILKKLKALIENDIRRQLKN